MLILNDPMKYWFLSLLLFVGNMSLVANNKFIRYNISNELPSNRIYKVIQDSIGYMWFASDNGLIRFDGKKSKVYQFLEGHPNSISSNNIYELCLDRKGRLWIGLDQGVDIYNPKTDSFEHFSKKTRKGESIDTRINDIMEDSNGDIWISTCTSGVFRYLSKEDNLISYKHDEKDPSSISQDNVYCICEDHTGMLWFGTYSKGACSFSKQTNRFKTYKPTGKAGAISDNSILRITEDYAGNLWFGTFQHGIERYDRGNDNFVSCYNGNVPDILYHIHDIIEYKKGVLLIASDNGLCFFKTCKNCLSYDALTDKQLGNGASKFVYSAYKDREGGLWFGTFFSGVEYCAPFLNRFENYKLLLKDNYLKNIINVIREDSNGRFWIGTDNNGIYFLDPDKKQVLPFKIASDINTFYYCIHDILLDGNKLYAATYERGLEIFDLVKHTHQIFTYESNNPYSLPSSKVFSLYRASDGHIYVSTSVGLCYYDQRTEKFTRLAFPYRVSQMIEDKKQRLWLATLNNGLFRYDLIKKEFKSFQYNPKNNHSICGNSLTTLAIDKKGQLWIGSGGYGLCRYDEAKDLFVRYLNLKLPNNFISNILVYDRDLWISTVKGLICWTPDTNKSIIYTTNNGIPDDNFIQGSGIIARDGTILLGTLDGICHFNPQTLMENQYNPPVIITDMRVHNESVSPNLRNSPLQKSIDYTDRVVLGYNQSFIEFDFASLSYLSPETNQYLYKMEGFDKKWHITTGLNAQANYTNLPPGEYTFVVKGTNNDGKWSNCEARLNIEIKPFFLKSSIAVTLYAFLFISLILYLYLNSRKRYRRKIQYIQAQTEKELYKSKVDFFTNIAHEIRTPLSLIVAPVEYIIKSTKLNNQCGEYLSIIHSNTLRLYNLVNQLLDFKKVDSGCYKLIYERCDLQDLFNKVAGMFHLDAVNKGISIEVNVMPHNLNVLIDKEALTKIISNLLNNALRFAKSVILVTAELDGNQVVITVSDDGKGIAFEESSKIFEAFYQGDDNKGGVGIGLHLVQSLVLLMHGTISSSECGKRLSGLEVLICFPVDALQPSTTMDDVRDHNVLEESTPELAEERDNLEAAGEKSHSILVVDDNKELLNVLNNILYADYTVFSASNGSEALKVLDKNYIDLIICDIMMDGINGIELCRKIKSDINTSHIPLILLTAKTDLESKMQGLDSGADAYIEKPFYPSFLLGQITNLLKKQELLQQKYTFSMLSENYVVSHSSMDEEFMHKCTHLVMKNIADPNFAIETMASELCMSRTSIFRKIKSITGMTPNDFMKTIRLKRACQLMSEGKYRIVEIVDMVGFNSSSYFAKCFAKQYGMLPTEYMKKIKDEAH
jgi:signal transduction histidine kinase/ligand-binding sensor domain-containing protein/CheY-like chemotaxis protein/AraC-like DNA-binding protein